MTLSTHLLRRRGRSMTALIVGVVFMMMVLGAVAYYFLVETPLQAQLNNANDLVVRLSGLENPISHRLDPQYTDSTGTLLADAPADPAKQVDPPTLTISYVPTDDEKMESEYKTAFADLMTHISQVTGKPVVYFDAATSDDQLRALRDGKLMITTLNTGNVPLGVCEAGFIPVAGWGDANGSSKYQMEIVVAANSTIKTVDDLRGHELTLTDPGSNSGYKAPLVELKNDFGLLPGRDFGVRYSGGHEQSVKGLADGTYEVIAGPNDVLNREIASGIIKPAQFRSIYKSEDFPTASIGYAYNLKPELAAKIRDAILNFSFKGTSMEKEFAPANQTKFLPVDYKNDWALVRRIDDSVGFAYVIR
jgi:phosphonate transport system substrate-binding protein